MTRRILAAFLFAMAASAVLPACTEVGFPEYQPGQGFKPNGSANMQMGR